MIDPKPTLGTAAIQSNIEYYKAQYVAASIEMVKADAHVKYWQTQLADSFDVRAALANLTIRK